MSHLCMENILIAVVLLRPFYLGLGLKMVKQFLRKKDGLSMIIKTICKKLLLSLVLITACCNSSKVTIPNETITAPVKPSMPTIDPTDVIIFNASVTDETVNKLIVALSAEQEAGAKEIKIIMNSPGGVVEAG